MSATSIVDDRLLIHIDNKWIDAVEHMNGAIHKAAILAQKDGAATIFDELGFLIAPATTKIEEAADSAELIVEHIHRMAIESLSPEKYENLLDSLTWLCKTRKISNSLPSGTQQQKDSIALAIDKFQEMAGNNVEAEFSVGEIIDTLEEIAQQKAVL